jgi:hypothetical protein
MQAQQQQLQAQQQIQQQRQQQQLQESYRAFGQQMAEVHKSVPVMTATSGWPQPAKNSLPTQQQLNTPGNFTGQTKYASDGTLYREYRRLDGSTYWATPAPGEW